MPPNCWKALPHTSLTSFLLACLTRLSSQATSFLKNFLITFTLYLRLLSTTLLLVIRLSVSYGPWHGPIVFHRKHDGSPRSHCYFIEKTTLWLKCPIFLLPERLWAAVAISIEGCPAPSSEMGPSSGLALPSLPCHSSQHLEGEVLPPEQFHPSRAMEIPHKWERHHGKGKSKETSEAFLLHVAVNWLPRHLPSLKNQTANVAEKKPLVSIKKDLSIHSICAFHKTL